MESKWFLFFTQFSSHSFYATLAEVMNAESWKSYQERQDFIAKDCLLGSPKPLGLLVVCLLVGRLFCCRCCCCRRSCRFRKGELSFFFFPSGMLEYLNSPSRRENSPSRRFVSTSSSEQWSVKKVYVFSLLWNTIRLDFRIVIKHYVLLHLYLLYELSLFTGWFKVTFSCPIVGGHLTYLKRVT